MTRTSYIWPLTTTVLAALVGVVAALVVLLGSALPAQAQTRALPVVSLQEEEEPGPQPSQAQDLQPQAQPPPSGTLDANCPGPGNALFRTAINDVFVAQTFVAKSTGTLTSAQVEINKPVGSSGDFVFEIRTADGAGPTNTKLATTTVSGSTVPDGRSTITANFGPANAAHVVSGTQYALVVKIPTVDMGVAVRLNNPCPDGNIFFTTPPGVAPFFVNDPRIDMVYSVFVTPQVSAPPDKDKKKHHKNKHHKNKHHKNKHHKKNRGGGGGGISQGSNQG